MFFNKLSVPNALHRFLPVVVSCGGGGVLVIVYHIVVVVGGGWVMKNVSFAIHKLRLYYLKQTLRGLLTIQKAICAHTCS